MAYDVYFFQFSKKKNSTAQPLLTNGKKITCKLMDGSGMLDPTLTIDGRTLSANEPEMWNYAYIPFFARYYWITDWAYISGLWNCTMTVDVLASWKTDIGSCSTFIYRANTGNQFSDYVDNLYPYSTYNEHAESYGTNPYQTNIYAGTFVLGLTGQGGGVGGITYVAMDVANFSALTHALYSNPSWLGISDISNNLVKALVNPLQYVHSCMWFPETYSNIPGTVMTSLDFAWWNFAGIGFKRLDSGLNGTWWGKQFTIPVPKHPAYSTYGREVLLSPATRYSCVIQPFGQWNIDPLDLANTSNMQCAFLCDFITGEATLQIGSYEYDGDSWKTHWFMNKQAQIGVPIAVNQITQNVMGAIGGGLSVIGGIAGAAMGNPAGALSAVSGIGDIASSLAPKSETTGTQGNTAFYNLDPVIRADFLMPSQRSNTLYGVPINGPGSPSAYSGYVKCAGNFYGSCTYTEREQINNFMESGFFYE